MQKFKKTAKFLLKYPRLFKKKIFNFVDNKIGVNFYYNTGKTLESEKELVKAKEVYIKGLKFFPNNYKLNLEIANLATSGKDWLTAIKHWNKIIEKFPEKLNATVYIKLGKALKNERKINQAEDILYTGLIKFPENRGLLAGHANIAMYKKDWHSAAKRWGNLYELQKNEVSFNDYLYYSITNGIIGNKEEFNNSFTNLLKKYSEDIEKDKNGYRKVILFNNGSTRIEYYKKFKQTNTVIITFDSINITWDRAPFGFNLLNKENVDIIAVRRRKKDTYQQDLSHEDFNKALKSLLQTYDNRVAYGYSLGGYTSLYFTAGLNFRILSIAPRNPLHPLYGEPNIKGDFNHAISQPYHPDISPIIVYDPKNNIDGKYIENDLKVAFPKAEFIEIPYGGHGMAQHLLKMGLLKNFILTVLHNEGIPKYNEQLRLKSYIYYLQLGAICLKRNKPNWAFDLAERSLELIPSDERSIRLKIKALKELKKYKEAIQFAEESLEIIPKDIILRELLIEMYISTDNLKQARKVTNEAINVFGESKRLITVKREINEKEKEKEKD